MKEINNSRMILKNGEKNFANCLSILFTKLRQLVSVNMLFFLCLTPFFAGSFLIAIKIIPGFYDFIFSSKGYEAISLNFTYQIMLIPAPFAFCGPFVAGLTKVVRDIAREEHTFLLKDFFTTAGKCFFQSITVSFVDYWFYIASVFAFMVYSDTWLFLVMTGLTTLFYMIMKKYVWLMVVSLDLKLRKIYKNGFLLVLACFKNSMKSAAAIIVSLIFPFGYLVFAINSPAFVVFLIITLLFVQFSLPRLFQCYYSFQGIIEKVVDPYYEGINKDSTDESIKSDAKDPTDKSAKYDDETQIAEKSEFVYINGKLVRRELAEQETIFRDNNN